MADTSFYDRNLSPEQMSNKFRSNCLLFSRTESVAMRRFLLGSFFFPHFFPPVCVFILPRAAAFVLVIFIGDSYLRWETTASHAASSLSAA